MSVIHKIFLCVAVLLVFGSAPAFARSYGVNATTPPPPPQEIEIPPPSRSGYLWTPGYWTWDQGRYVWIPAQWIEQRPNARWEAAHWVDRTTYWHLVPGHWQRMRLAPAHR